MSEAYSLRPPLGTDLNLIQSSFLKSTKKDNGSLGRSCSPVVYSTEYPKIIHYLLEKSKVIIACKPDEPDVIYGYIIYEPHVLIHFVFVKAAFRKFGIATAMVKEAFPATKVIEYTHKNDVSKKITKKHPEFIFNPFRLYRHGA